MLKDRPTDAEVTTDRPLLRGMTVEEFERGRYTAWFISDWRASAEAYHEEIAETVGQPD